MKLPKALTFLSVVLTLGLGVHIVTSTAIFLSVKPASANDSTLLAQVNEKNTVFYNNRGLARLQSGDIKRAIEDFNQALRRETLKEQLKISIKHCVLILMMLKPRFQSSTAY